MNIIERDFHLVEENTPITKDELMLMLKICLQQANYFVYEDKYYRQKKGMFMGSPLAQIMVARVIVEIVDKSLTDDDLTSIQQNLISTLEAKLNSFDPNVEFRVEIQDF